MQRHYYSDPDLGTTEVTDRVARVGWESKENAEEGSTAMVSIVLDDPGMDLEIVGHRKWFIIEDESEATDNIIFGGFVADQSIGRSGGDWTEPFARVWTVTLTDANGVWQRRVMVGADCKRPDETDVERMQWLLSTAEAALFDDVTTYVNTGSPVAMDACDYRGQTFSQIADDCAQASGKNWWAQFIYDGADRNLTTWYGRDGLTAYSSDLRLTNDLTDVARAELEDGTSDFWPISLDTKLNRDPSRVFSGCYLSYEGGAVYRYESTTAADFAKRDFVAPSLNVKSQAKASARALRYLAELDEQDERITTSVELPKERATMIRAGMRIPFRALHLPGYENDAQWCRVLSCAVEPISSGDRYRLTMELAPTGSDFVLAPYVEWVYFEVYGGETYSMETSDDGSSWSTAIDYATMIAGTTNPPNATPATYPNLVQVPLGFRRHRYWRLHYRYNHGGGYYAGQSYGCIRLLDRGDFGAICHLGTVTSPIGQWWYQDGNASAGTPPRWTGDREFDAVLSGPAGPGTLRLWGGTVAGVCDAVTSRGLSFSAAQGCGYGVEDDVLNAGTIDGTWTFDLMAP